MEFHAQIHGQVHAQLHALVRRCKGLRRSARNGVCASRLHRPRFGGCWRQRESPPVRGGSNCPSSGALRLSRPEATRGRKVERRVDGVSWQIRRVNDDTASGIAAMKIHCREWSAFDRCWRLPATRSGFAYETRLMIRLMIRLMMQLLQRLEERLQMRRQSRCARALFFGRQMRESANLTHAAIRRASAAEWLGHVGLGRGVVEANLLTGSDRATGQQRSTLNARIGIARVVQEAPRMSAAHLFVRQRTIGLDVHGFIELDGVARRARLQSSRDGEDARSARNIAGCEETHAVIEVADNERIAVGIP